MGKEWQQDDLANAARDQPVDGVLDGRILVAHREFNGDRQITAQNILKSAARHDQG